MTADDHCIGYLGFNNKMHMKQLVLILIFVSIKVVAEPTTLTLANNIEAEVQEVLPTRATPTLHYRQAMDSIPSIYPKSVIIDSVSAGKLSLQVIVVYSMVSYKKNPKSKFIASTGTVLVGSSAWRYYAEIPENVYPQLKNALIEKVANLSRSHAGA